MSARSSRTISLFFGGVVLLVPTFASLLPAAVPSDPAEGGEQSLRMILLLFLLLSTLFGSAATMLFIRAFLVGTRREIRSRKAMAILGAGLMSAGFCVFLLLANDRTLSGYLGLFALMMWYTGGGAVLSACFKASIADQSDPTA